MNPKSPAVYERIKVLASYIVKLGTALRQSNEAYNKAVGSMESRVLPSARKFQELGVSGGDEIPAVEPVEVPLRILAAEEVSAEKPAETPPEGPVPGNGQT